MEPEGSFSYSQEPATCLCPELDRSSPCFPNPRLYKVHFNIIFCLLLDLPSGLLPSGLPTETLYALLAPYVLHALPISVFLSWSNQIIFGEYTT